MTPTPSPMRLQQISNWQHNQPGRLIVFALIYFFSARIGLAWFAFPQGFAMIWLANGVALAVLLISTRREWPALLSVLFVVDALSSLLSGWSVTASLGFALVHTLQPALCGWLLTRSRSQPITFTQLADVLGLAAVIILINGITAWMGALTINLSTGEPLLRTWLYWWIIDTLGILVITPLIVTWATVEKTLSAVPLPRWIETIAWFVVLGATTWFMFGMKVIISPLTPRPYMLFPVLIWGSLRFSPRLAAGALTLVSAIALTATVAGGGSYPLGGTTPADQMIAVEAFFCVASLTTLLLVATLTERKQAETSLQENQTRLDLALRSARMGVWNWDSRTNRRYFDDQTCRLLGIDPTRFTGTAEEFFAAIHPDDHSVIQTSLACTLEKDAAYEPEYRAVWPDGSLHFIVARGKLERDENGQPARINGVLWDNSERKVIEEALIESENKFRSLFENMTTAFALHEMIYDEYGQAIDYRFLQVNPAFEKLTGLSAAWLQGKKVKEAMPGTEQYWIDVYGEVAATGEPIAYQNYSRELDRHYDVWAFSPQRGRFAVIFSDITDRKTAEAERERLLAELKRMNKELESLVFIASHDLRSPLVNLQGFGMNLHKYFDHISKVLTDSTSLEEVRSAVQPLLTQRIPTALHFIDSASTKMEALTDALLRLSRVGRAPLQIEQVDMSNLFHNILDTLAFQIEKANARIVVDQPLSDCRGDKNQLNQVFSNLLDNALKYRSPDRTLEVTISSQSEPYKRTYIVADNGVGIAPEYQEKIWELFYRLEEDKTIPGEGLGLTVTRRIVERHGGRVWVESQADVGSRFFVELPVTA